MLIIPTSFYKTETPKRRIVKITFDAPPTELSIDKQVFRYGKSLAYSFSMDDSLGDAAKVALPMFSGGNILYDGGQLLNYPGLYYTDGCGNDKPFGGALMLNASALIDGPTGHYLGYADFRKMYINYWNYLNHSFSHKDSDGSFSSDPTTKLQELRNEIQQNYDTVKAITHIQMQHFSSPSRYMPYYDVSKTMRINKTSLSENGAYIHETSVESIIAQGACPNRRKNLSDEMMTLTNTDIQTVNNLLAATSYGTHYWLNEFIHRCGQASRAVAANSAGFAFSTFKDYFERLALNFGKAGSDNVWFADYQTVWEYIMCYKWVSWSEHWVGNTLWLTFDYTNVDSDFRNHSLSLKVTSDTNITSISFENFDEKSFKINTPATTALINFSYKTRYETTLFNVLAALVRVVEFENIKTQAYKDAAQAAVLLLANGSYRQGLQGRIDSVTVIADSKTIQIDFNGGTPTYNAPVPWNIMPETKLAAGSTLLNLLDTTSSVTPLGLLVTTSFNTWGSNGLSSTDPNQTLPRGYPYQAVRDYFQANNPNTCSLKITGCTAGKKYDIYIMGARAFTGGDTEYNVQGVVRTLMCKNNISNTASWIDVIPVNGEITISVLGKNGFAGYLNVLEIIEHN